MISPDFNLERKVSLVMSGEPHPAVCDGSSGSKLIVTFVGPSFACVGSLWFYQCGHLSSGNGRIALDGPTPPLFALEAINECGWWLYSSSKPIRQRSHRTRSSEMTQPAFPLKQGLYDPQFEHDSCGVGFVVDVKGRRSHRIVEQGIQVLLNLEHRGACGSEPNTGDGAGILLQIPHGFFARECENRKFKLPRAGDYAVGMVFLPRDGASRRECEHLFEEIVNEEGQRVLGWRTVPTDASRIGPTAKASRPVIRQIFIGRAQSISDDLAFERRLYVIRKRVSKGAKRGIHERGMFYVSSLSSRTIVYKGMLTAGQLMAFYPELGDSSVESALALVPFAVQHEYLSQLGARASLSLHRSQRRDQHAARKHQLDARARKQIQIKSLRFGPA